MPLRVMRTPRSLDLEITSRCNHNCCYCYYLNNDGVDYTDLPTVAWLDFFSELSTHRVMSVSLCGGEPLMRRDFLTIIDGIVANQMRFDLLTNGSLMTEAIACHLKATGRCDMIQVSLDGSSAGIHELLRGEGTFGPALRAIRLLKEYELPVTVRTTVHPGNIDDLPAVAALLLDDLGLQSFSTNAASALGSYGKYGQDILLNPQQRLKAMKQLVDLERRYPGRILANAGPLADWKSLKAMEGARQTGQPIPGRGKLVGCGCIYQRLAVRADGAYVPCVMLPQMVLGHIGQDRLGEVWTKARLLEQMRRRVDIPLSRFETCADCDWQLSCTGNCPGTAFSMTGQIDVPCPESCLKRFEESLAEHGDSLRSHL